MDSLLTLIDRWYVHERNGDPECDEARRELELRLVTLESFLTGLHHAGSPGARHALRYVAGTVADKAPE